MFQKLFLYLLATLIISNNIFTRAVGKTIDAQINDIFTPLSTILSDIVFASFSAYGTEVPFIVLWLIGGGIYFTFYMGFINLSGFKQSIKIVSGKYDNPDDPGEITHFQALTAAISGTVGLGNIAGVAIAISIGGPGATFWMILGGFFGMTTKFVECTLGHKYRKIDENGVVTGGPMYYLSQGLAEQGLPKLGKLLGSLSAIICIAGALGSGALYQVNQ
ncbi:MAG: alanine:cation symporter family protein, partial [Sphingomonadales bacterium]